jgi:hypothetical protein
VFSFAEIAFAQENIFPRMVGKWRELATATTIIVEPDGAVFAQGGPFYGQIERSIEGGGNFAFENRENRCVYDIAFLENGGSSWGLRHETKPGTCPKTGNFVKISEPGEAEKREVEKREEERQKREAERQAAQADLDGIDVVYFGRAADEGKVIEVLARFGLSYSTRDSSETRSSNVITCGSGVPVLAIRRIANILIDAGVPIRAITPSEYPEYASRITIESYHRYEEQPVITKNQISSLTECKETSARRVTYWDLLDNDPEAIGAAISTMYLITEGDVVTFYYEIPGKYMQTLVNKDTLKFKGKKNGQWYQGKAYVFSKYCGGKSIGYDVSGSENDDHTLVTLRGPAPVIEKETCRVHHLTWNSKNSTIIFRAHSVEREITAKAKQRDKNNPIH